MAPQFPNNYIIISVKIRNTIICKKYILNGQESKCVLGPCMIVANMTL